MTTDPKTAPAKRRTSRRLLPHEFLLKVSQGQAINGHVPTFAERMAAARLALPYFAPRRATQPAEAEDRSVTVVMRRYGDDTPAE